MELQTPRSKDSNQTFRALAGHQTVSTFERQSRMHMRFVHISTTLTLGAIGIVNQRLSWAEAPDAAGTWRGESLCAAGLSACQDERVVYYIKHVPSRSDLVVIQADKIVNGEPVTMGTGEWRYDPTASTLEWRMPQQVWFLKIAGSRMEGTLKRTDGTILRNMTLEKDR